MHIYYYYKDISYVYFESHFITRFATIIWKLCS